MTKETNKSINFEEVLDQLTYKTEHVERSIDYGFMDDKTHYSYDQYTYFVSNKEPNKTYRIGKRTEVEICGRDSSIDTYQINERPNAVCNLKYDLVKNLFLTEIEDVAVSDVEKIKALKAKEQEILAFKKEGIPGDEYLKFYSHEQMADLIEKTIKEKDDFFITYQEEEKRKKEQAALEEQKRKEKEDKKTARKRKTKEVKEAVGKVVGTLTAPIVSVAESIKKTVNEKKEQRELAKIKNNLGKGLE